MIKEISSLVIEENLKLGLILMCCVIPQQPMEHISLAYKTHDAYSKSTPGQHKIQCCKIFLIIKPHFHFKKFLKLIIIWHQHKFQN